MFTVSIIAKILLTFFSTNAFIRNINKDLSQEAPKDIIIVSVAASLTVYISSLVLFYFAGVFDAPIV
jgi:O-antigen/teichoic acid export membrane protein